MPDPRTRHEIIDDLQYYLDNAGGLANPAVAALMAAYRELSAAVRDAERLCRDAWSGDFEEVRKAVLRAAELLKTDGGSPHA